MKNNTEQIGRYLQNEMNAEEKTAFEKQLSYDTELQDELAIQQQILSAINTAGLKSKFGKAVRTKFISRLLIRWAIVIIVVGSLVFYALKANMFSHSFNGESIRVSGAESFVIDNTKDTIIETEEGVVFGIPANAFGTDNKKISLEIKTAISPDKIMQQGLSTTSNGQLLQTAGMFYINGYVNEKPVILVKKIDVSVPTKNVNPKMQLFNGVQDSNGRINWVNPKPIINGLRTYDITTLDFYPSRYIPTLKALGKDYTNKKYTDSLYYSFSGYPYTARKSLDGKVLFQNMCASCHIMGKDATGPNLQGVLDRWDTEEHLKQWVLNWKKAVDAGYPRAVEVQNFSPAQMQVFEGQLSYAQLEAIIRWVDQWQPGNSAIADVLIDLPKTEQTGRFDAATDTTNKPLLIKKDSTTNFHYEIDPSRIRAIWNPQFNNTILATKEFEERLHFLHELCTAEYFQGYLEMMDRPMYEIDQACADHSTGEIRQKFLELAARKDGGVMLKDGMQEKLSDYFQKKLKAYREAAEKTWAKREEELARLASIADTKRREQATRDYIRADKNFNEEFCINLTNAYKQIGVEHSCNITITDTLPPLPPPTKYYNVTIQTLGWKNLDAYVFEATTNRESMSYTDSETGKTATLTYKELSIAIDDQAQYDNVFVYLLPDSLNSFQRIEEYGNVFKDKLNMLLKYDAIAIAYKGDKVFFYKQTSIQPGQYTFKLSSITETELKKILNSYSKEKSTDMLNEYEYQLFEQQEAIRNIQLRKELDFITQIKIAIWNCFDYAKADNVIAIPGAEGEDMGSGPK